MAHFARDSDRSAPGADGVPGVRRTSYYLELQQQDGIFFENKNHHIWKKAGVDDLRTFGPWRREAYEICAGSPELPAKRPERLAAYTNWRAKPAKPAQVIDVTAMTAGCFARRRQSPKQSWLRRRRRRCPAWIVPTSQNAQNTHKIGFGIVLGENRFLSVCLRFMFGISPIALGDLKTWRMDALHDMQFYPSFEFEDRAPSILMACKFMMAHRWCRGLPWLVCPELAKWFLRRRARRATKRGTQRPNRKGSWSHSLRMKWSQRTSGWSS